MKLFYDNVIIINYTHVITLCYLNAIVTLYSQITSCCTNVTHYANIIMLCYTIVIMLH